MTTRGFGPGLGRAPATRSASSIPCCRRARRSRFAPPSGSPGRSGPRCARRGASRPRPPSTSRYARRMTTLLEAWMDLVEYLYDGRMMALVKAGTQMVAERGDGPRAAIVSEQAEKNVAMLASGTRDRPTDRPPGASLHGPPRAPRRVARRTSRSTARRRRLPHECSRRTCGRRAARRADRPLRRQARAGEPASGGRTRGCSATAAGRRSGSVITWMRRTRMLVQSVAVVQWSRWRAMPSSMRIGSSPRPGETYQVGKKRSVSLVDHAFVARGVRRSARLRRCGRRATRRRRRPARSRRGSAWLSTHVGDRLAGTAEEQMDGGGQAGVAARRRGSGGRRVWRNGFRQLCSILSVTASRPNSMPRQPAATIACASSSSKRAGVRCTPSSGRRGRGATIAWHELERVRHAAC